MKTTLCALRAKNACTDRYSVLVAALGPNWGGRRALPLLKILRTNGLDDCLWAFRAVTATPETNRVMRLIAADFAASVLDIYENKHPGDRRPRLAIDAARDFSNGKITAEALHTAWSAAWAAPGAAWSARAAARAAGVAARAAGVANNAALAAARAAWAAQAAAWAAGVDAWAAERKNQTALIRKRIMEESK